MKIASAPLVVYDIHGDIYMHQRTIYNGVRSLNSSATGRGYLEVSVSRTSHKYTLKLTLRNSNYWTKLKQSAIIPCLTAITKLNRQETYWRYWTNDNHRIEDS
jgi:hypothetical protein